ncbi:MAG: OB-fold domain-containing protein [Acidimicrobiia bacterium]|nr:OB-fold domain-containing protein [Acidimicrobiia bacterium]
MAGIVAYGSYVPYHRLDRAVIAGALGVPAGRGTRAVASFDEDTTTMAVEAGRAALGATDLRPEALYLATADPAYLDKTNANAVHAALGLPASALAVDVAGSVRSGVGALRAAMDSPAPALAVLSDLRTGLSGSSDEINGGDAAAAFVFGGSGAGPVIAEVIGQAHATEEFLDRWRTPGDPFSRVWEERFGEHAYVPLALDAWHDALKTAGLTPEQVDHVVLTGVHARAARGVARQLGVAAEAFADDLSGSVGFSGTAHLGLLLADVLDRAESGKVIACVLLADGASVLLLRTTEALASYRPKATVAEQVSAGSGTLGYETFLTWRGMLRREPPRRPDPDAPAAPPSLRHEAWKFAFTASRCEECGTRHLPPTRVCAECGAVDRMQDERLADTPGTVATFTVDRLAFTPSPPMVAAVVDFEGGGRFRCEVTDVDPSAIAIGDRVEMTFRRIFTAGNGVHNYFWKARPVREAGAGEAS